MTVAPDSTTHLEHKQSAGMVVEADDKTGIVTLIPTVTGVVDEVDDLIEPGAYTATLTERTPKAVWAHDWSVWVGRTLEVVELMPGDPRLPEKTANGDPWPAEAGAVLVRCQFNLETQAGRDAYSNVKFFGAECAWSIGYQVRPGKATRDSKGVRHIRELEWYEYSPVLFGANRLAATLKDLARRKGLAVDGQTETDLHTAAVEEVDWDGVEAIGAQISDDGDASPLWSDDEVKTVVDRLLADGAVLLGEAKAEGGADRNRGNAEALRRWYVAGEGAARIRWGTEGSFMRCVRIAGDHMTAQRARGWCALRHRDATGKWPGEKRDEKKTLLLDEMPGSLEARIEALAQAVRDRLGRANTGTPKERVHAHVVNTFTDHVLVRVYRYRVESSETDEVPGRPREESWYRVPYTVADDSTVTLGEPEEVDVVARVEPKSLVGSRIVADEKGVRVEHAEPDTDEKSYPYLAGSVEERQAAISEAVREAMAGAVDDEGRPEFWVYVHSTFDDHVVVQRQPYPSVAGGAGETTWWRVPYTFADGTVTLGEPEQIELTVSATPTEQTADAGATYEQTAAALAKALDGVLDVKSGRVLSRENEGRLVTAVTHLVQVLRAAGVDVEIADDTRPPKPPEPETTTEEKAFLTDAEMVEALRILAT